MKNGKNSCSFSSISSTLFKSGVWNWAYKMPKYVLSLLVKPKLKNLLSVLRYRLPRFIGKRQNQRVATFWHHKLIEIDRLNLFRFVVHSEARTRLDNLTKIQSSNAWISSWNAQMVHFPLCRESVLGMPRIEIEFELDIVFCFGIHLALYAVFFFIFFFFTGIYLQHVARPVESDRPVNILFVFPSVHPSVRL